MPRPSLLLPNPLIASSWPDLIPRMTSKSLAEKQRAQHPAHADDGSSVAGGATQAAAPGNKVFSGSHVKKARRKSAVVGAAKDKDKDKGENKEGEPGDEGQAGPSVEIGMDVDA